MGYFWVEYSIPEKYWTPLNAMVISKLTTEEDAKILRDPFLRTRDGINNALENTSVYFVNGIVSVNISHVWMNIIKDYEQFLESNKIPYDRRNGPAEGVQPTHRLYRPDKGKTFEYLMTEDEEYYVELNEIDDLLHRIGDMSRDDVVIALNRMLTDNGPSGIPKIEAYSKK